MNPQALARYLLSSIVSFNLDISIVYVYLGVGDEVRVALREITHVEHLISQFTAIHILRILCGQLDHSRVTELQLSVLATKIESRYLSRGDDNQLIYLGCSA